MTANDMLLEQVREFFQARADVAEQRSIGGSRTFTVRGNMCCGVGRRGLMVRVGPEQYAAALAEPHAAPLQMGGKQPLGYIVLAEQALADDGALERWVHRGLQYALTLAPKAKSSPRRGQS